MKALTLHQPWATLIAIGAKTIETRSWSTKHRGPLAIHAAKTEAPSRTFAVQVASTPALSQEQWNEMPFGAVVATCELVDVVPTESIKWCEGNLPFGLLPCDKPGEWMLRPSEGFGVYAREAQRQYGDYTPGRFAWLLDEIRPLDPPRPATGHQGLWRWEVVPA